MAAGPRSSRNFHGPPGLSQSVLGLLGLVPLGDLALAEVDREPPLPALAGGHVAVFGSQISLAAAASGLTTEVVDRAMPYG